MSITQEKEWKIYTFGPAGLNLYGEADTRAQAVAMRQKAGLEIKNSGGGAKVIAYSASGQIKVGIHLK